MTGTGSNSDCTMASAQWIEEGGNLYYVRDWGGMLHDQWRQENGVWYYFRGWGAALNNGWSKIGNDWYWFNRRLQDGKQSVAAAGRELVLSERTGAEDSTAESLWSAEKRIT